MRTLPCRYFFSKGELHREDGRLAFYRQMFGEPKLEQAWADSEWRALRLHRSFFELELHLLLRSGDTKQFELSITEEEAIAWAGEVGLKLQTEEGPGETLSAESLPEASSVALPPPLAAASPEPVPPEGSIERVMLEAVPPAPEVLFESVTPSERLGVPSTLSLEGLLAPQPPETSREMLELDEDEPEPPVVVRPRPRPVRRPQQQDFIKRLLPTPGHWAVLLVTFFVFPIFSILYLGYRYREASR